jgi:hypothetical protein
MSEDAPSSLPALIVTPMNDEPIDYPLALPSTLSSDAQLLHRHGGNAQGRLDRDVFSTERVHYVSREDAAAFEPTERMLVAIAELDAAGLSSYDAKYKSLHVTRVHNEYTFARGRGSQLIKVSTFDKYPEEAELLAVLIGGDLETQGARDAVPEVAVRARHESATDFEHDASSTALLMVRNISQPSFGPYGRMSFSGVLTEARLYPIGVDPVNESDADTRPGSLCDTCDDPHPFAPFQPPFVSGLKGPKFVTVETRPLRPYLVAAPPAFTS